MRLHKVTKIDLPSARTARREEGLMRDALVAGEELSPTPRCARAPFQKVLAHKFKAPLEEALELVSSCRGFAVIGSGGEHP